jgi:hypothetical protein
MKVYVQANSCKSIYRLLFDLETSKGMLRAIVPFSTLFGVVCAVEFSVNERIRSRYGDAWGIVGSALTGATLLTAADHIMFRQQKQLGVLRSLRTLAGAPLFTGFLPMAVRESIFILSVIHLGPGLGRILNGKEQKEPSALKDFEGRVIMGAITTFFSQPFDVLARHL